MALAQHIRSTPLFVSSPYTHGPSWISGLSLNDIGPAGELSITMVNQNRLESMPSKGVTPKVT